MANTLTNVYEKILARSLPTLRQQVMMPRLVNLDYRTDAVRKGDVINIPTPAAKSTTAVTPGPVPPTPSNTAPGNVAIPIDQWEFVDFFLTNKDMAEIDKDDHFVPMELQEGIKALANSVNTHIHSNYTGIYGYTGTAGTTPFASTVGGAVDSRKVLHQQLCDRQERRLVLDFDAEANALALSQFSDLEKTGDRDVKIEGTLGRKFGFDIATDDHVTTHTAGTITTGLIAKASTAQAAGLKAVVCTTAASTGACALVVGDIISFAGHDQTYTVTAAATQASAATDVTVNIEPGLTMALSGSEAVTVRASHVVNLAFQRQCFAFVSRPLETLSMDGRQVKSRVIRDRLSGITLRLQYVEEWMQSAFVLDILWGSKLVRPEFGCRLAG